jgi:hypothetical protein
MSKGVSVGELVGGPYCILLTTNFHIKTTPNLVNRAFTLIHSISFGFHLFCKVYMKTYPKWTKQGERIKERTKLHFGPRQNKEEIERNPIQLTQSGQPTPQLQPRPSQEATSQSRVREAAPRARSCPYLYQVGPIFTC